MSRLLMVSVKDKVTGEFLSPFYVHNQEEAARVFKYQLDSNQIWQDNAEQFEMYTLAILDTETGNLIGVVPEQPSGNILTLHPDSMYKGTDILS